jgi:ribonucleotide reductase alpha subunit
LFTPASLSAATTTGLGTVIVPAVATSGLTNSSGTIGLATATTTQLGGVKVDGTTIKIATGIISVPTATTLALGVVKVDGSTIQISSGIISVPTASTSQILGNNECFEFFTNNIYTRRTLAGDFPLVNKYLIDELNNIGLWDNDMKQLILANNGSISDFNNIPEQLRKLFQTIWEIKQIWILKNALARAPFVCQTQSMNIFQAVPDYQKLYSSHFWAWKNGLKTGIYYLRSKPAKDAKKFTIDPNIQLKLELLKEPEICESCSA